MRLTDISIKSLKPPRKGAVIYSDDTLPGFGVRVSQAGVKSFVLTHGRTRTRETIGRAGIMGLKDARTEAKRRLAEYTLGKNKPCSVAWNVALQEYLEQVKRERKPRTHADYQWLLNRHFRFGETKLSALKPQDFITKLDRLSDTPAEKRHAFVVLRAFINWAYRKHYLDQSPLARLQAPSGYNSRSRVLTDEELKKVWQACEGTFGDIVKVLILTGQRVGEVSRLTPEMVRDNTITLPSWGTKNGHEHTLPIGEITKAIVTGKTGFVFPARERDNWQATLLRCVRGYIDRLVPFEKYCLNRSLVFSLEPRHQLTYDPRLLFRGELSVMSLTRKQKIQCIRLR